MKKLLITLALGILLPTVLAAGEPRTHIDDVLVKFVVASMQEIAQPLPASTVKTPLFFHPMGSVSMAVLPFRSSGKVLSIQG